jgi:DNA-binding HxlR family transcriptional regulator
MRQSMKKKAEWGCDPEYSCSVEVTLSVIGGKWKLLIIRQLQRGVSRFGQLRRAIPRVTQTMLTQQLRELEEDGVVSRTIFPEIPPRVEYELTEFGKTLDCVLQAMGMWGDQYHAMVREKKRATRGLLATAEGEPARIAEELADSQPV